MLALPGFLLTIIFGLLVSFVVAPKLRVVERLGVSYVLGLGLQTLFMFYSYLLGFKFNLVNTLGILLVLILVLFAFTWRKIIPYMVNLKPSFSLADFTKTEKIIIIALTFFVLFSLICTLYFPVAAWDALVLYDWRAKLFVATGGMEEGIRRGYFFGVPLLTSLAHTWVYFLRGKQPEFIYTIFLFSFVTMIYGALREYTTRIVSLIAVLIITTTPDIITHSTFAYTNFPYTVYFVMSTVYLYIWITKEKKGYLVLSALMLGLSAWTRSTEPFWLVSLVVLFSFCLYKRKVWQFILYSLLFFSIRQPWVIFENSRLPWDTTVSSKISEGITVIIRQLNFSHAIMILQFLYKNVFFNQLIYFLGFLAFLIWERKVYFKRKDFWLSAMIVGYVLLIILGTYVFSLTFRDWEIGGSAARMTMFFPPLIVFYIAITQKIQKLFKRML